MIRLLFKGFTYEEMQDIIQLIQPLNTRATHKDDECLVIINDEDLDKLSLPMLIAMATIEMDERDEEIPAMYSQTGKITRRGAK